jgi:hypothetical protein
MTRTRPEPEAVDLSTLSQYTAFDVPAMFLRERSIYPHTHSTAEPPSRRTFEMRGGLRYSDRFNKNLPW